MTELDMAQTRWSQPQLFPGTTPAVSVEVTFYIEGARGRSMVAYEIRTTGNKRRLVGAGLEWVTDWNDPLQRNEILSDIFATAKGQLDPF